MKIKDRIQDVLRAEAAAIMGIDVTDSFVEAVSWLVACRGKVVVTGIGKAGQVALKYAAILNATGTPAFFLHAAEAAHGDLGSLGAGDLLIAFSVSGTSSEVVGAVSHARQLGVGRVLAVTASKQSPLGQAADLVIEMGRIEEACPLGLTATASTAVMSAIGDALALAAMEQRGYTAADFGKRHPGGALGQATKTP
ncbi:SIS domain-containing protein [Dongia rigui]|uniref:SIS domain-containing protein n=1 Tax=Dongia rigui TaxID=940149 RepID=A0ABU5DXK7_9PROT|nr:SIS domain-containing protein [Dongia rigui]MDY0872037.1 SIS domain-containing protein [Dongia rigui]